MEGSWGMVCTLTNNPPEMEEAECQGKSQHVLSLTLGMSTDDKARKKRKLDQGERERWGGADKFTICFAWLTN